MLIRTCRKSTLSKEMYKLFAENRKYINDDDCLARQPPMKTLVMSSYRLFHAMQLLNDVTTIRICLKRSYMETSDRYIIITSKPKPNHHQWKRLENPY